MGYSTKDLVNSFPAKVCGTAPGGGGAHFFSPPPKPEIVADTEPKLLGGGRRNVIPILRELKEKKEKTFNVPAADLPPQPTEIPTPEVSNVNANASFSPSSPKQENSPCLPSSTSSSDAVDCEEYDRAAGVLQEMVQSGYPLHLNETPSGLELRYNKTSKYLAGPDEYLRDLVQSNKRGLIFILRKRPRPLDAVQQAAQTRIVAELVESQKRQQAMLDGMANMLASVDTLASGPEATCDRLAEAMVRCFRETDPEQSRKTFFGIARDVRIGKLPASTLKDAITAACRFQGDRPGRVVVRRVSDAVKSRWKSR
jgi:hypothetical protein